MFDPFNNYRRYMVWTFILIIFLLITGIAVAGEKILHSKIVSIQPEKTDEQYCFIKVQIRQDGDTIYKEEILECADGKKGIDTQVIGSYLVSFITEILAHLNTADIIVGRDMLLKHYKKCV